VLVEVERDRLGLVAPEAPRTDEGLEHRLARTDAGSREDATEPELGERGDLEANPFVGRHDRP
jgi:hypothetical protein